jgi:hypothetical protein
MDLSRGLGDVYKRQVISVSLMERVIVSVFLLIVTRIRIVNTLYVIREHRILSLIKIFLTRVIIIFLKNRNM